MNPHWLTKLSEKFKWFVHWPIRISYGITVCNEATELDQLLRFLLAHKDPWDEIIVLQDVTQPNQGVEHVLSQHQARIKRRQGKLEGDFSQFKNQLLLKAKGQYLFQIDADELPHSTLMASLKRQLRTHYKADCWAVPRVNRVEGLTPAFISQYQWQVDEHNRINFPDYQVRIFRLNRGLHWRNKVHEELTGCQRMQYLPILNEEYCLYHLKDIERQRRQNDFYASL